MEFRYHWKTEHTLYMELQETLNRFSQEGWDVFTITPVGDLPERPTIIEQLGAVYFIIVARKLERG